MRHPDETARTASKPDVAAPGSDPGARILLATNRDAPSRFVVAGLAEAWTRAVADATFIPGPRHRARSLLEALLWRMIAALRAEPPEPAAGREAGHALVAARMSSPAVLGASMTLLSRRLPAVAAPYPAVVDPGAPGPAVGGPGGASRLAALLGEFAAGFTEALRDAAVSASEEISRAEKAAWRRQQLTLQRRLQIALLHDPVTGLANRATLLEWLATGIAEAGPDDRLGVCVLNLDQFKAVNDTLGHDRGDQLLRKIARHLRPVASRYGYGLAHLGADEFALLIRRTTGPENLVKAVDRALRALPDAFVIDGHRLTVTVHAGIAEGPAATAEPIELLHAAHAALSWAKTDRRDPCAIFDPVRSAVDLRRHELTVAMPAGLDRGEFVLDYQPLTRLADRRVVGVEALVRWRHPVLGRLGPDQFITLAERTGLIERLGRSLLRQACRQAARWQRAAHPPLVSVNLSPVQLTHPGLAAAVSAILDESGLPPEYLQLEVTESAELDDHHDTLRRLTRLGVRLAIDDFGTGYSSLAYLADLPVSGVKLAARFVRDVEAPGPGRRAATMLPSVITMCHDLGIAVTAEGIETAAQARRLADLGCDLGQGYYFGRPCRAGQITGLLRRARV